MVELKCIDKEVRKVKTTGRLGHSLVTYVTLTDGKSTWIVRQRFLPYKVGKYYFMNMVDGEPVRPHDGHFGLLVFGIVAFMLFIALVAQGC